MNPESAWRHAAQIWLDAHAAERLTLAEGNGEEWVKAGLLPFIPAGEPEAWSFLVMRPRGKHPELGAPPLQLCKGTRMGLKRSRWRDLETGFKHRDFKAIEPLEVAALREAVEELGIVIERLVRMFDAGDVAFTSAKTGRPKHMRLFAAEIQGKDGLLPAEHVARFTQERRWVTAEEFACEGREDHVHTLRHVHQALLATPYY